ncbi:hypothetical protein [Sulfitobacter dubius]|uniref:hypothetical protein n=1 Tax=Sulfitobacter dubius TaxID=218673 RepID=UPI0008E5B251|nr:hypothetical protein [Sulfitobacter dubius]SFH13771.1 hypothetical protein SAMN04488039_103251 [Sulfitobacter dubius]
MTIPLPNPPVLSHIAHKTGTVSPIDKTTLWDMEERFWTSDAASAQTTTATNAIMIFPYPPGILQGDQIWEHIKVRTGWRSIAMSERRVMRCGEVAMLSYRVSAEKAEVPIYEAFCASTYLYDAARWLRVSHQQTPVA